MTGHAFLSKVWYMPKPKGGKRAGSKPKPKQVGGGDGLIDVIVQRGGADSYAWHRNNVRAHLQSKTQLPWEEKARSGEEKRAAWIQEVRDVMGETGLNWREAMKEASARRQQKIEGYRTVVQRTKDSYTGRRAENVRCSNPGKCPGRYTKPVTTRGGEVVYRPNAHNVSRAHLTTESATKILREYYKERAHKYKDGRRGATKAMRQDISKRNKRAVIQSPCPTKVISVNGKHGKYNRRVVDRDHPAYAECRSNWLYRSTPGKFDMEGVDAGEGKASKGYGKKVLPKTYKSKKPRARPSKRVDTTK